MSYSENCIVVHNLYGLETIITTMKEFRVKDELLSKLPGTVIGDKSFKSLVKITLEDSLYYLKLYWDTNMFSVLKNIYRGDVRAVKEAKGLLLLQTHGFNTPQLISYGCVGYSTITKFSYIITKEVEKCSSLDAYLSEKCDNFIMAEVGKTIGLIHKNGMVYGDFHSENILISNADKSDFIFLDWMGVVKNDDLQRKLFDIAKFLYYSGEKKWPQKEQMLEHFLQSYWNYSNKAHKVYFEYEEFKREIDKSLKLLTKIFSIYRLLVHLG